MPFKKRSNPFEEPVSQTEQRTVVTQPVQRPSTPPMRKPAAEAEQNRIKYTATMSKDLHIRLKVAAAMSGLQISALIEEAIQEKLDKEGL